MKFKYGQKVQTIDTLGFYPTGTIISIYVKYNKTMLDIQLDPQYGNFVVFTRFAEECCSYPLDIS